MRVALIFNLNRPDTMGIYFLRAFRSMGYSADHFWTTESHRLPPGYDLYVRIDDDDYEHPLPAHARPAVYYLSDVHLPHVFRKVTRYARPFDLLFCPMQSESQKLRRLGFHVEWLNPGYDPEFHADLHLPRVTDVAFIGTEGGDPRRFYLQLLRERYPNCRIGPAPHQELGLIYSQAKIGFSFPIRRECLTMRNFEIMAAGAMLILPELRDNSIVRSGFTPGKDLIIFRNPRELFDRIDYFLTHLEERQQVAAAGQRKTLSSHSYRHRVRAILEATHRVCGNLTL